MKKKVLSLMLVLCLFVSGSFMLSACKDKRTKLESSMILLAENKFIYTGEEIKPNVTVKSGETEINADNYTISYANNVNVGEAIITITAKEKNKVISGSASVSFEILPAQEILTINSYEALKSAVQHGNNSNVVISSNITIPAGETFTVPEGVTIDCGTNKLTVSGTLVNNGCIRADVNSKDSLIDAIDYASEITLKSNIDEALTISSNSKNIKFNLDLNGYSINNTLKISNFINDTFSQSIDITITNYSYMNQESIIGNISSDYGLNVEGNENVKIEIQNVTIIGKTAVYYGDTFANSKISLTCCELQGSIYAALIEGYATIDASQTTFICTSDDGNAYRTTKGTHNIISCNFKSNQRAILIISLNNYNTPSTFLVSNLTFETESLHIEEVCETDGHDYFTITGHNSIDVSNKIIIE